MLIDRFNNNIELLKEETIKILTDSIDSKDWKVKLEVQHSNKVVISISKIIRMSYAKT